MHTLGHGFCQRRKSSKRPQNLHIRKVSFSGSSLYSGYSEMSPSTAAAAAFTTIPIPSASSSSASSTHTFGTSPSAAPPRLQDRAFIRFHRKHPSSAFYDDEDDEDDDDYSVHEDDMVFSSDEEQTEIDEPVDLQFPVPPRSAEVEGQNVQEHEGYFFIMAHAKASPTMQPGSRWSESTISSVDIDGASEDEAEAEEEAAHSDNDDDDVTPSLATDRPVNFSYKRAVSAPDGKRPHMPMDSVEDYIKRGGWKRKGIIFHPEDVRASDSGLYGFSG
jgi:hypothetical protein